MCVCTVYIYIYIYTERIHTCMHVFMNVCIFSTAHADHGGHSGVEGPLGSKDSVLKRVSFGVKTTLLGEGLGFRV